MTARLNGFHKDVDRLHISIKGVQKPGKDAPERRPLDRKYSSPMMPAFMVSAPGKVILFGAHAGVHGKVRMTRVVLCRPRRDRLPRLTGRASRWLLSRQPFFCGLFLFLFFFCC